MKIEKINIKDIKLNPNNPRTIKDDNFKKLVKSVKDFPEMLDIRPIVVNKDMIILGGNMRYKACLDAGLKEIPIIIADNLTEEQQKEFLIKDNVSGGDWNWETLIADWDSKLLTEWGMELEFVVDDEDDNEDDYVVPEVVEQTDFVLGDLIEIGEHRLLCGDSTNENDMIKVLNGEKVNMVFTDPPYNIDYQGIKDKRDKIKNDKMSDDDFVKFLYDALNIDSDTFYVCCSWQYSNLFRRALEDLKKPVKSFIVWNKVNPAQHLDKYFKQHEFILYHGKFGGEKTLRGDIWEVKREKNTVHPTMKPISLISIALNDNPTKKLIYDGFLGSGSTMVACHQLKRKCYGIELDPKYCQVIVDRMVNLDSKLEVKLNGNPYIKLQK